jgi:hypothetical protein
MSAVVLLLFVAFVMCKWGPFKATHVLFGVIVGVFIASTALGGPIRTGVSALLGSITGAVSGYLG